MSLVVAAGCSSPEPEPLPPVAPPAQPAIQRWSAQIFTHGGYAGVGKGFISVGSDETSRCSAAKLPADKRLEIEKALAAAQPEQWKTSYRPDGEHMTDQFYYSLALKLQRSVGTERMFTVAWQDESFPMLPEDLRRLYDALWAARQACP